MIKLLRRFVSEEELPELTVESISGYLEQMNNDPIPHVSPHGSDRDAEPSNAVLAPNSRDDPQEHDPQELAMPNDNSLFQEEMGCMTLDSMGKYRKSTLDLWSTGSKILIKAQDMSARILHFDGITLRAWSVSGHFSQIHASLSH